MPDMSEGKELVIGAAMLLRSDNKEGIAHFLEQIKTGYTDEELRDVFIVALYVIGDLITGGRARLN